LSCNPFIVFGGDSHQGKQSAALMLWDLLADAVVAVIELFDAILDSIYQLWARWRRRNGDVK